MQYFLKSHHVTTNLYSLEVISKMNIRRLAAIKRHPDYSKLSKFDKYILSEDYSNEIQKLRNIQLQIRHNENLAFGFGA